MEKNREMKKYGVTYVTIILPRHMKYSAEEGGFMGFYAYFCHAMW